MLLPWGSLLRAVVTGDPDGLGRLRGLCSPGAEVEIVVGHGDLDGVSPEALTRRYAEAGLAVRARAIGAAEAEALGTTWAKRLARSDPERRFWRLGGVAVEGSRPGSAPLGRRGVGPAVA